MTKDTIQYYTRKISNSNPTEIIVLVYEMAEIYMDDAIMASKDGDFDEFSISLNKASKCVNDLINALDLQHEIAKQLLDIYLFINREISMAIVKKDAQTVTRLQAMLTKLKKSFEELAKKDTSGAVMGNTQEVYAGLTYGNNSGRGTLTESTLIQANRGFTV